MAPSQRLLALLVFICFCCHNAALADTTSSCATSSCLADHFMAQSGAQGFIAEDVTYALSLCASVNCTTFTSSSFPSLYTSIFVTSVVPICCAATLLLGSPPSSSIAFVFPVLSTANSTFGGGTAPLFHIDNSSSSSTSAVRAPIPTVGYLLSSPMDVYPANTTAPIDVTIPFSVNSSSAAPSPVSRRSARVALSSNSSRVFSFVNVTTPTGEASWPLIRVQCTDATWQSTVTVSANTTTSNRTTTTRVLSCNTTAAVEVTAGASVLQVTVGFASAPPTQGELQLLVVPVTGASLIGSGSWLKTATTLPSHQLVLGCSSGSVTQGVRFNVTLVANDTVTATGNATAMINMLSLGDDGTLRTLGSTWVAFAPTGSMATFTTPSLGGARQVLVTGNVDASVAGGETLRVIAAQPLVCVTNVTASTCAAAVTPANSSVAVPPVTVNLTWSDQLLQQDYNVACGYTLQCPRGTMDIMYYATKAALTQLLWNGAVVSNGTAGDRFNFLSNGVASTSRPISSMNITVNAALQQQPYLFGAFPDVWRVPTSNNVTWASPSLARDYVPLVPSVNFTTTSSGPQGLAIVAACLSQLRCRATGSSNITLGGSATLTIGIQSSATLGPFLPDENCRWYVRCASAWRRIAVSVNASFTGSATTGTPPQTGTVRPTSRSVWLNFSGTGGVGFEGFAFFTVRCERSIVTRTVTVTASDSKSDTRSLTFNGTTNSTNGTHSNATHAPTNGTVNGTTAAPSNSSTNTTTAAPTNGTANGTTRAPTSNGTTNLSTTPAPTMAPTGSPHNHTKTRHRSHTHTKRRHTRTRRVRTKTPRTRTTNITRSYSLSLTHQDTFTAYQGAAGPTPPVIVHYVPGAAAASVDPVTVGIGIGVLVGIILIGAVGWKVRSRIKFWCQMRRRSVGGDGNVAPISDRTNEYRWYENAEEVAQDLEQRGEGLQRSDHEGMLHVPTVTTTRATAEDPFVSMGVPMLNFQPEVVKPVQHTAAKSNNPLAHFGL